MTAAFDSAYNAPPAVPVVVPATADPPSAANGPASANKPSGPAAAEPPDVAGGLALPGFHLPAAAASATTDPNAVWNRSERTTIWEVPFDRLTMPAAVDQIAGLIDRREPAYVVTANLNYVMLHHRSERLRRVTAAASLILADGQPIVWRSRLGRQPLPERVAGSELIDHLARRAAERSWRVYFLGGRPPVALKCSQRLAERYPGLKVAGVESPPFRKLTPREQADQVQRIRDSGADLLLVAFGQPKGELWIAEHYRQLAVPVSIQLGASFDFIAGTAQRAPLAWQRCGAEWAYRMLSDPKRLLPRYAANAWFLAKSLAAECLPSASRRPAKQDQSIAN